MAFWKNLNLGKNKHVRHKSDEVYRDISKKTPVSNNSHPRSEDLGDSVVNNITPPLLSTGPVNTLPCSNTRQDLVFGDLGDFSDSSGLKPRSRKSRLSKNLSEVLSDPSVLSTFQQYMDCRDAASYLGFLNDVRNFDRLASVSPAEDKDFHSYSSVEKYKTVISPLNSNSTSSSSGFGDDYLLDSPGDQPDGPPSRGRLETDTLTHSLHSEAVRIFQKYFEPDSSNYLASVNEQLASHVRNKLLLDNFSLDCFNQVHQYVWNLLETDFFPDYLHSEFHYRHQMEILTSGKLTLNDVLYSETILFYFMEFMDQEGRRHWLEFWLAADNFRQQWSQDQASTDALVIYNRYFSLQAAQPLGLSDSVRSRVEENICRASVPAPDCFEHALQTVLHIMEKHYLPLFLCSQCYLQHLSEVITAMKTSSGTLSRHKRAGSESTLNSEISGLSTNTFSNSSTQASLAHATNSSSTPTGNTENGIVKLANTISNHSLLIETRQLSDPDLLWRRKKYKSMSLGRISPLGRFYTEVEPYPDKKAESRFSKAVKKIVYMEEDQAREEFAWQIAAMIVEEIHALTRGIPTDDTSEYHTDITRS